MDNRLCNLPKKQSQPFPKASEVAHYWKTYRGRHQKCTVLVPTLTLLSEGGLAVEDPRGLD